MADVGVADQPDPLEGLEVAVDGSGVGRRPGQLAELLGGERLGSLPERFEQLPARVVTRRARGANRLDGRTEVRCVDGSGGVCDCHRRGPYCESTVNSQGVANWRR